MDGCIKVGWKAIKENKRPVRLTFSRPAAVVAAGNDEASMPSAVENHVDVQASGQAVGDASMRSGAPDITVYYISCILFFPLEFLRVRDLKFWGPRPSQGSGAIRKS